MSVKPIPEGYYSLTPYLYFNCAAAAIDFYGRAFGAKEIMRMPGPDGRIMHAELQIGDSRLMMCDEFPEMGAKSPKTIGGNHSSLLLYVADVDAVFAQAIAAGATERKPVANQFYGDRMGTLEDPFGHVWSIGTHVEEVSPEEMSRRMEEWTQQNSK